MEHEYKSEANPVLFCKCLFRDEISAREFIEGVRWPDGATCTRCGSPNVLRMAGKTQAGMFLCRECRNKFSCRVGTFMEHSHVPLHKWLLALFMVTKCERYLSPQKLKRELGLGSYRTAWLMAQRIRDALSQYRRELDRSGCRRDPMSTSADRGELASACCEKPWANFDDVLSAVIASRPKPPARVRLERRAAAPKRGLDHPGQHGLISAATPNRVSLWLSRAIADTSPNSATVASSNVVSLHHHVDASRTLAMSASNTVKDPNG